MPAFSRGAFRLADSLNVFAGSCFVAMTALTSVDVVVRIFRDPIPGTSDIVGFLGSAVAAFAAAHRTVKRDHMPVDVMVSGLFREDQQTGRPFSR